MSDDNENLNAQLLAKAERYCAMGEQCAHAVCEKLRTWGADEAQVCGIIARLEEVGFLDEHRYVRIYCNSKVKLQKWGRRKIAFQLRRNHLSEALISEGMATVSDEDYFDVLRSVAASKWRTYSSGDDYKNRAKLTAYLLSRGFEMDEIQQVIKEL